jgi:hypothetical protein
VTLAAIRDGVRSTAWYEAAACHPRNDYDPEDWALVGLVLTDANKRALAICNRCPVKVECGDAAVVEKAESMIRGGLRFRLPGRVDQRATPA